ncbi:hypothetical protein PM02_19060 [Sulfitobacter mediterraneus]|uniref:Uncharacterized protein n=1 Tax=Sulfitobacter mediterraneus TaxID=83219 RepID=A0A061SIC9_9RHOB|nr:hypothetical protein PM02_19060 [Sulfitobacter mediterraneus]
MLSPPSLGWFQVLHALSRRYFGCFDRADQSLHPRGRPRCRQPPRGRICRTPSEHESCRRQTQCCLLRTQACQQPTPP